MPPVQGFPDRPEHRVPDRVELIPPDLRHLTGPLVGSLDLPADPNAPLPGFVITDIDPRDLILAFEFSEGRVKPNGRRELVQVDFEKLKEADPNFGIADEIYQEAGRWTTKTGGKLLGIEWHRLAKETVQKWEKEGKIKGIRAEVSYGVNGKEGPYSAKDTARVDLVWTRDDGTVVIVDLKTGGAQLSAAQIEKIVRHVSGGVGEKRVLVYQYKP